MPPLPTSPFVISPTTPLVLHCMWGTEKTRSPRSASAPPPLPLRLRCPPLAASPAVPSPPPATIFRKLSRPSSPRPPPFFLALAKIHPVVAGIVASHHATPRRANKIMTTTIPERAMMPGQDRVACRPSLLISPSLRLTTTRSGEPLSPHVTWPPHSI